MLCGLCRQSRLLWEALSQEPAVARPKGGAHGPLTSMSDPADTQRLIGGMIQEGKIASVDLGARRCTVTIGDMTTAPLPWLAGRAGDTTHYSPPTKGEGCVVLCPEGDEERGLIMLGSYSTAFPAPSSADKLDLTKFADGAIVSYDAAGHVLTATLPAGATIVIVADGGMSLKGNLAVDGDISATGTISADTDVLAGGISGKDHVHDKVKAGTEDSGKPK